MTTPTQPPVLLTPAAQANDAGGGGGGGGSTTVEGSITVTILNQTYTLTGTLGQHLIVEYHASFEDAITVGSIDDIVGEIGKAVGYPDLGNQVKQFTQNDLANVPVLKTVFSLLTEVKIKITDLEINTQTNTYGVGLALDFTQLPAGTTAPTLLGIELLSVGFKVTRVNPTPAQ